MVFFFGCCGLDVASVWFALFCLFFYFVVVVLSRLC